MVNHAVSCQTATSTKEKLSAVNMMDQELHCRCGFSSYDGYALARHLIACDRYGAVYSTVEAAQASVVERSMLDSLGLVRRDGDDDDEDSTVAAGEQTTSPQDDDAGPSSSSTNVNVSFSHEETVGASSADVNEGSVSGVAYDPSQSLYNIAGAGEQQFNTQLSFDDLGPPSVLPAQDNNDRTPQLKDDYQSLATPRVPEQQDY